MEHALRSHAAVRSTLYRKLADKLGINRNLKRDNLPSEDSVSLLKIPEPFDCDTIADTIIINTLINPVQTDDSSTGEIAIRNGRIQAIGKEEELAYLRGDSTEIIDAGGRTIMPAFCDSHLHLLVGAERIHCCDLEGCDSLSEITVRIKDFAKKNPELHVIHAYGLGYLNPPILPEKNARKYLDVISPDKPLFIYAHDLHTGWANSCAIEEAGQMRKMPPWPDLLRELNMEDSIVFDDDGLPGGEFREPEAYFLVEGALRSKHPLSVEQKLEGLSRTCQNMHTNGVVSVHSMGLALPEEDIESILLLLELEHTGSLGLRVSASMSVVPDENMLSDIKRAAQVRDLLGQGREGKLTYAEIHTRLVDMLEAVSHPRQQHIASEIQESALGNVIRHLSKHLHSLHSHPHRERLENVVENAGEKLLPSHGLVECNTIKIFMDGVVEKDTAYRFDHAPAQGIPAFSREALEEVVCLADRSGLQVAAHCIGDASVSMMLDAVAVARKSNYDIDRKRGHLIRHRIEHIELCRPADLPRFSALEVIASMQPLHERPPTRLWHQKIPQSLWPTAFAWKMLLENGAHLAFGSDWPIVPSDCLMGIQRAVTRQPWLEQLPESRLSEEQAAMAFSANSAYAVHEEMLRGQIKPGMLADLVILETTESANLQQSVSSAKVHQTIMNGKVVYCCT